MFYTFHGSRSTEPAPRISANKKIKEQRLMTDRKVCADRGHLKPDETFTWDNRSNYDAKIEPDPSSVFPFVPDPHRSYVFVAKHSTKTGKTQPSPPLAANSTTYNYKVDGGGCPDSSPKNVTIP